MITLFRRRSIVKLEEYNNFIFLDVFPFSSITYRLRYAMGDPIISSGKYIILYLYAVIWFIAIFSLLLLFILLCILSFSYKRDTRISNIIYLYDLYKSSMIYIILLWICIWIKDNFSTRTEQFQEINFRIKKYQGI